MGSGTVHLKGRPTNGGPGDVTQDYTDGAGHVRTGGSNGDLGTRVAAYVTGTGILFADPLTVTTANIFEFDFSDITRTRFRAEFHSANGIPFVDTVLVCLAPTPGAAANTLAKASGWDTPENTSFPNDDETRAISPSNPVAEWDLGGSSDDSTTLKMYGVGIRTAGTGTVNAIVVGSSW